MTDFQINEEKLLDTKGGLIFKFPQPIVKEISDKERICVLMEGYSKNPAYILHIPTNIWCVGYNGNKLWEVEDIKLPKKYDCYSAIAMENGKLAAYSGSGFRCEVDWETGKISHAEFVK